MIDFLIIGKISGYESLFLIILAIIKAITLNIYGSNNQQELPVIYKNISKIVVLALFINMIILLIVFIFNFFLFIGNINFIIKYLAFK